MKSGVNFEFLGGVADGDNLTGSFTVINTVRGKQITKILIDAGLKQGGQNTYEKNKEVLRHIRPADIDYIILTHSHIDHVGLLPFLTRYGFKGRIICTESTASLLAIMLEDSAKIQAAEAKNRERRNNAENNHGGGADRLSLGNYDRQKLKQKAHNQEQATPLYNLEDVKRTEDLVKNGGYAYKVWIRLDKGIFLKFYPSGHVLGGAICVVKINNRDKPIYLGFSGDLGREDGIILPPPEAVEEPLDSWLIESTYGGKTHPSRDKEISKFFALIRSAAAKKQKIIIPSFALERTQEILYKTIEGMSNKQIPSLPIYLDSPMSVKITQVFADNWEIGLFNDQSRLSFNPFSTIENKWLKTISDRASSQALTELPGPHIIIASAGNCDAGPIRGHLSAALTNPYATICIIGYMPMNSLGRKLKERVPIVYINGEEKAVRARIVSFESFSAHADSPFLVKYTKAVCERNGRRTKIFINHGEERSAIVLKAELRNALGEDYHETEKITLPKLWEEFKLF